MKLARLLSLLALFYGGCDPGINTTLYDPLKANLSVSGKQFAKETYSLPFRRLFTPEKSPPGSIEAESLDVLVCNMQWEETQPMYPLPEVQEKMEEIAIYFKEVSYDHLSLKVQYAGTGRMFVGILPNPEDFSANLEAALEMCSINDEGVAVDLISLEAFVILPSYNLSLSRAVLRGTTTSSTGTVPIPAVWVTADAFEVSTFVFKHELGHALLGFAHANALDCGDDAFLPENVSATSPVGENCQLVEYGNTKDPMGHGQGHFSAPYKEAMGWISSNTISHDGIYSLYPLEVLSSRPQLLKIEFADIGNVCIEYRRPIGYDNPYREDSGRRSSYFPPAGCLMINLCGENSVTESIITHPSITLIDTTPNSISSDEYGPYVDFNDACLLPLQTFSDSNLGISVLFYPTENEGHSYATVNLDIDETKLSE